MASSAAKRSVVTISATYGAGGSVVAPAVAELLGLPFLDRALPPAAAVYGPIVSEAATEEERTGTTWSRMLEALARTTIEVPAPGIDLTSSDQTLRERAETTLREFIEPAGGVVLGWAGSAVLADAYHVLLDGPIEARVRQACTIAIDLDEEEARHQLTETDRTRTLYWRRLYRRDWLDRTNYHLYVDSTAVDLVAVRDIIVAGARSFSQR